MTNMTLVYLTQNKAARSSGQIRASTSTKGRAKTVNTIKLIRTLKTVSASNNQ
jgi:hypothetical protein